MSDESNPAPAGGPASDTVLAPPPGDTGPRGEPTCELERVVAEMRRLGGVTG